MVSAIAKSEIQAKDICARIRSDDSWKRVVNVLDRRLQLFNSLSKEERLAIDLSSAWSEFGKSYFIYNRLLEDSKSKYNLQDYGSFKLSQKIIMPLRVIRACGQELFEEGLLPPAIPKNSSSVIDAKEFKLLVNKYSLLIDENDKNWVDIFNRAQNDNRISKYALSSMLFDATYNLRISNFPDEIKKYIWFPFHNIYKAGPDLFSKEFNFNKFDVDNDLILAKANDDLQEYYALEVTKIAKENAKVADAKAREKRVLEVRNGNIKVAQSCAEVAEGFIDKKHLGGALGLRLSEGFQDVYAKPTNAVYAGIGKVIGFNNDEITVVNSDAFRGEFFFVLRHDRSTLWFGKNVAINQNINFVGRYVDNTTVSISRGYTNSNFSSRVYEVLCLTN